MNEEANEKEAQGETPELPAERMSLVQEFGLFLWENKLWWMAPIILVLLILIGLVVAGGGAAAPFIYTLF